MYEPTYTTESNVPQYTYLANSLGMTVSFENETFGDVDILYPSLGVIETLTPRETKYYTRDVDTVVEFSIGHDTTLFNLPRHVNTVVIKRVGDGRDTTRQFQPVFMFTTRKFTNP